MHLDLEPEHEWDFLPRGTTEIILPWLLNFLEDFEKPTPENGKALILQECLVSDTE